MKSKFWIKCFNFEYWPILAFYIPLFPYFLIKGLLRGQLFYFTNVNPGIDKYGGLFFDSKNEIDKKIPQVYRPKAILVNPFSSDIEINNFIESLNLKLPLILKPDSGERGKGVVKIESKEILFKHLSGVKSLNLLQEYIALKLEYGVFVYFCPKELSYKISSLTEKKYFTVIGDGKKCISELVLENNRGIVFYDILKENSSLDFNIVPANNEIITIHTHGNHCKGTRFINRTNEITHAMITKFNTLMLEIGELNYGRFDLKVNAFSDLETFENISIIEFNGISAEPIHLYDKSFNYIWALQTFISHWQHLDKLSVYMKTQGYKAAKFKDIFFKIVELFIQKVIY